MKAIIFNSGIGKRMGGFTQDNHKSMAKLANGETIFERQLRILSDCGIRDFVITTGPFEEQLKSVAAQSHFSHCRFVFVRNPDYEKTNYIYSMYLARDHFDEDMLLLHGDLVFNRKLVESILGDKRANLALVNKQKPLPDKDFKVRIAGGKLGEVSVGIFDGDCFAFQPLYKLNRETIDAWARRVNDFVEAGNVHVYAENALNEISHGLDISMFSYENHCIDEVDTLEDLHRVSQQIRQFDFDEQRIYMDTGDFLRISDILAETGAKRPMLVCDSVFDMLFISRYLNHLKTDIVRFNGFGPNPVYEEVAAGVALFKREKCDFIISVGGGSAIDTAKNIKLFSVLGDDQNYLEQPFSYSPVRHIAVPTTAGTGSESTRFSVLYHLGEKQSIAHDCILPEYVILDPKLLETLPDYQKKATMMDALCQCIESIWSVNANEKSREYAKQGIELIMEHMTGYLLNDKLSRAAIMQAANLSGRAITISQTTAAHAMSYKLSTLYGIAHGHAVALCLPHVWRYLARSMDKPEQCAKLDHLKSDLDLLNECFGTRTDCESVDYFELLLETIGLESPLLKQQGDLDVLVNSVNVQRLSNNPIIPDRDAIRNMYGKVFRSSNDPSAMADVNSIDNRGSEAVQMKELQTLELEILLMLDEFCKKHGITYYLGEGTLLGAIRHGGFIPWDDDVDVMMPREDYDRFISLATNGLPEGYNLDSMETNPKHWVLGAKIQLTRGTKFIQEKVRGFAMFCGPYIDVFPLDDVPEKYSFAQHYQARQTDFLRRFLFIKTGYSRSTIGKSHRYVLRLISPFVSVKWIYHRVDKVFRKFNGRGNNAYMVNLCSYYPRVKETFPKSFFGKPRLVDFEGHLLPVPQQAEYMLMSIYGGDYMRIPLPEMHSRKHWFTIDQNGPSD